VYKHTIDKHKGDKNKMTIKFNGLEYQNDITLKELCEQLNKADGFKMSSNGFNKIVEPNKEEITAEDLINELLNNPGSPSYWKATKPLKEREYYNYRHQRDKRALK
jgi:hypothetical protein